jgi:hypothetical protein
MDSPANSNLPAPCERPPRRLWQIVLGLTAWLIVPWAVILGTSLQGIYVLGVAVLLTVVGFGTAVICVRRALESRQTSGAPARGLFGGRLAILTGTLPMRAAAVQLLIIPTAVAVGFTLIALVEAIERS